jgi:putative ABC transport system permease protein
MIRHYFLTTIRTLRQNMLYTALSVFGIALTFVFVCILLLLVKASKGDFIPPKYAERTWQISYVNDGYRYGSISKELCENIISKMQTPEIIVLSTKDFSEQIVLEDRTLNIIVNCVSENFFDVHRFKFISGRPLNKQEITDGIQVAVIDRFTAGQYFGKNEDPIGKNIELSGKQYRIIGVVENKSALAMLSGVYIANMWLSHNAAPSMQNKYVMTFTGKDKASLAEIQAEFNRVLNEINTAGDFQYSNNNTQSISQQIDFLEVGGIMIILILMLIPALNILSLNISKSHERSEEIAIRKAFGAPTHTIFGQLFFENTLLTLVGAAIGMCITPFLLSAVDKMMLDFSSFFTLTFSLHFDWITVFLVAVPCVLLFSFLSGSIPALIIAKKDIVNVLKGEIQ